MCLGGGGGGVGWLMGIPNINAWGHGAGCRVRINEWGGGNGVVGHSMSALVVVLHGGGGHDDRRGKEAARRMGMASPSCLQSLCMMLGPARDLVMGGQHSWPAGPLHLPAWCEVWASLHDCARTPQ